ncbi:MAG: metallophosphatase family protein [Actinobacteria bacterium]|nr:metallophosphatase family protein [Actinomycetota bacterium]
MIALIGDTHLRDGLGRLPTGCLAVLEQADVVLHVGDLVALPVLLELRAYGDVAAVRGNVDDHEIADELPERAVVEADGMTIGLVHDAGPAAGRHDRLRAWFPGCDAIAYGHTHQPEVTRHDDTWILNPGSPTQRRRAETHTMIVVRDGEPTLVDLAR